MPIHVELKLDKSPGSPGPEVIKLISCSTHLSTKLILLINVKMPTIVGILTFFSKINTTSERLKARSFFICHYFSFYEQLKFWARYHTFVEIDHEIIYTVILLPSADLLKKGCCQLQAKVCAQITG